MLKDFYETLKTAKMLPEKRLKKLGTLAIGVVESTPVVWKDRLLRFEFVRNDGHELMERPGLEEGRYRFIDMETEEATPDFALGHSFGCCYTENGKMYVHGTRGKGNGRFIDTFVSDDLIHWEESIALSFPEDLGTWNTSVCKGDGRYVMAIEISGSNPIVGNPFTCIFAESQDLINWKLLDTEKCSYSRDRYTACPVIRYYDGFYYMIYLESAPCHRWIPYIVRSENLMEYELGVNNPIMFFDDEDKKIIYPEKFSHAQLEFIRTAVNCNNSDIDLCDWQGRTVIMYSWGNQLGREFLARAEYDGSEKEFLQSFFK
jgi:hypothetical protein